MTSGVEQSLKKRLSLIAKERNQTGPSIWHHLITERFLIRLARSPYHHHFIFKGGTLLARHIDIGRETRDLDFSIRHLNSEITVLQKAFDEIVQMPVEDGFIFEHPIVTPLEHFHMEYPGARVKIRISFGKSRFTLYIDLGFGDLVFPEEQEFELLSNANGPLFEPCVKVNCYPAEFIFAEKLETVIYRRGDNSRMKDFHDLYSLISAKILNWEETMKVVRTVFDHRKTPFSLSIQFDESELLLLQKNWERYLQTVGIQLPAKIVEIIEIANAFILQSDELALIINSMNQNKMKGEALYIALMKVMKNGCNVNEKTSNGHHFLQLLIKANMDHKKKLDLVKLSVERGANINSVDTSTLTPFATAVSINDKAIAEFLRSKGASTKIPLSLYSQYYDLYLRLPI